MSRETAYIEGNKAAWLRMLKTALQELGGESSEAANARWVAERAEVVAMLRTVCDVHGDNDWPDKLHLADVIDKHLVLDPRPLGR